LLDNGGEIAGKDGILRDLHRFDAHDFAETGEFANGDFADGFGSDVAQGDAGAASGEDELCALGDLFLMARWISRFSSGTRFSAMTFQS
jgi:hypothetical protein